MASYNHFIPQNVAPIGSRHIGVYRNNEKIGYIPLGGLKPPNRSKRLYSFGLIADPHVGQTDAMNEIFRKTLKHLGEDDAVKFTVIAGDLIVWVKEDKGERLEAFKQYSEIISNNSNGKPVFAIGGNHEQWQHENIPNYMKNYADVESCVYHFKYGDDLFVMAGSYGYAPNTGGTVQTLSAHDLKSVRNLMNENRNVRCFFIHHVQPSPTMPEYDVEPTEYGYLPLSFFAHFKNMTMFHGHSHLKFSTQETDAKANYREDMGFRSVHISALCEHSEGYIVDVYKDGYHLRGMNFSTGDPVLIATYWIDTTIQSVDEEY